VSGCILRMTSPSRSVCAAVLAAAMIAVGPASAGFGRHHRTNLSRHHERDPYKCTGQQLWFYDWHPGSDGMGGFGFWDDDIKVCQGPWRFSQRWLHWTKNQLNGK
jgi:hypothetical protein